MKVVVQGRLLLVAFLLAAGCGSPAKPSIRPPLLADRNWQSLVPILGDFGPMGGEFSGDFGTTQFGGYRFHTNAGADIEVSLERTSGAVDPVLIAYGPQRPEGVWGEARAFDDDGGRGTDSKLSLADLEPGTYLFVVTSHDWPVTGRYRIRVTCNRGCEGAVCAPREACAGEICYSGFQVDAGGCPTCDCNDACLTSRSCGPDSTCVRGRCVEACVCREPYAPVCGSDGLTYGNACEAACQNVSVLGEGGCRPDCMPLSCDLQCPNGRIRGPDGCETCACAAACEQCGNEVEPVCTANGRTVRNRCLAECEGERVAYTGECQRGCPIMPCDLVCPGEFARDPSGCPVCACDDSSCPALGPAVCGSNGVTYSSQCAAEAADVTVLFESPCPPSCRGEGSCPDHYSCRESPLCAQDIDCVAMCILDELSCGVTAQQCITGDVCQSGLCISPCDCAPVLSPVCTADGRTFDNACRARCAGATLARNGPCCEQIDCALSCEYGLSIGGSGCPICACNERPPCECDPNVVSPVCGADGRIYDNACLMRCQGIEAAEDPARCP